MWTVSEEGRREGKQDEEREVRWNMFLFVDYLVVRRPLPPTPSDGTTVLQGAGKRGREEERKRGREEGWLVAGWLVAGWLAAGKRGGRLDGGMPDTTRGREGRRA